MVVLSAGGDGQPVPVTVVVLDAVGFSRHGALVQLAWRRGIRETLAAAMRAAGVPEDAYRAEDRGDGFLVLVAGTVPKPTVVADVVRELASRLDEHNRTANAEGRIRLRVSVHQGDVVLDETGFAGDAVIVASRLIDARPIRAVFEADDGVDLAVIVSDAIFRSTVVERFRGLDPAVFEHVEITMRKYAGEAWVHVPRRTVAPSARPVAAVAAESVAKWDFLVSYAPEQERWAEWVAWELEATGRRVHVEVLDAVAGARDAERLHDAVRSSTRTLALLSNDYLRSDQVKVEWQAAWQADPLGMRRTLIPIMIEDCEPDGLLRGIHHIDLTALDEGAARRTLLTEIEASVLGRRPRRPAPPTFPR
jgi:hypothetical protein